MNETRNAGRGPAWGWMAPGETRPLAHVCPVAGCRQRVRADRLMCRPHWYQVPRPLRDAVWAAWASGDGAGTEAHAMAITAAIEAVSARQSGGTS